MEWSQHARARSRQRSIPEECVDLILKYGTARRRSGRTFEVQIKRRDKDRIIQKLKKMIDLVEKSSRKAVLVDGQMKTIITLYDQ